ncbi:hypothetical protein [Vandammella animalimorsus]|uniref:hypothetical protein n=1 Tax=Vandammella animalimorsus TaxID=2029117 RepID=UPI0015C88A38|nr:hypothetical protein [Vandammella animalimorsus]
MRKLLAATLAAFCATAWANVNDFDIEGFRLGMSEAQVTALLEEKCGNGGNFQIGEKKSERYNVLHSKVFQCRIKDTQEKIQIDLKDKVFRIYSERSIHYPNDLSKADRDGMLKSIYAKLLEKYGKPVYEKDTGSSYNSIELTGLSDRFDVVACWGDCETKEIYNGRGIEIRAGKTSLAALGLSKDLLVDISRILLDAKEEQAVESAFQQAAKAAENRAQEEAKKKSQQATEGLKF